MKFIRLGHSLGVEHLANISEMTKFITYVELLPNNHIKTNKTTGLFERITLVVKNKNKIFV